MNLFLLFLAITTFFIAGGLYFKSKGLKNITIALFTLLFGFEILYFISGTTEMAIVFPTIRGRFYFSIGFLYGPLLLFHFQSILTGKKQLVRKDLIHLIPLIVLNLYMLDILIMGNAERIAYYSNRDNFVHRILYLNYARSVHQIVYAILLLKLFFTSKQKVSVDQKFYLGAFSVIYIITTVVISSLTVFASGWKDFQWYYALSTIMVFVIAYILYKEPKFFQAIKEKYQGSGISEARLKHIQNKIETLFLDQQSYLLNDLSIESLALKVGVKKHHLSQMFTEIQKENFNDYVNKHRVNHAKKLLRDSAYKQFKIEAIAQEAGFNNKVTFYKAFSKFVGETPSAFRKAPAKP